MKNKIIIIQSKSNLREDKIWLGTPKGSVHRTAFKTAGPGFKILHSSLELRGELTSQVLSSYLPFSKFVPSNTLYIWNIPIIKSIIAFVALFGGVIPGPLEK